MFTSAHLYQIAQEIMSLLINKLHEKMITEGQDSTHVKIVNQKMFDRCGPLLTDPVEVHGRDPHLPALLPLHPP